MTPKSAISISQSMLCRHCARPLLLPARLSLTRLFTSSPIPPHPSNPPAAAATSAAQPFTTPLTPSPANTPPIPTASTTTTPKPTPHHPRSSTLAGTPLTGLAYLKPPAPAPIAREDSAYPSWLWELLSSREEKKEAGNNEGGDAFAKSKKLRRIAAKTARARVEGEGGVEGREVVVQRRSVDLAVDGEGGRRGQREREGLKRAMRRERRGKVREGNFLRGMR